MRSLLGSLAGVATTLALSGSLLLAEAPAVPTGNSLPNIRFQSRGAPPQTGAAAATGLGNAQLTFPKTSSAPLRWKNAPQVGDTNIDFNVRPVQYVDAGSQVEEVEHTTVVEREVRHTAFNLQLSSPKNGTTQSVPVRERTVTTTRVRTVAGPGGTPRSVLTTQRSTSNSRSNASPFADPFGDQATTDQSPAPATLGNPLANDDSAAALLQPADGGAFEPNAEAAPSELNQPGLAPLDAPLSPPEPGADPDDAPPALPRSLQQTAQPELDLDPRPSPRAVDDLTGEAPGRPAAGRRTGRCGIYNDRDCCEDETECLRSLDRVKTDTLRTFGRDRLDITPRYKPDADTPEEIEAAEARKEQQLALSGSRQWKNRAGRLMAEGQLIDLSEGKAYVQTRENRRVELKLRELNDDDLCFIAAWYNLPTECTLGNDPFGGRQFLASTFTWKASGLCHKPLYFEEVQLERYGHTPGPIAEPFVSGAHFFANIALLPYKMGISPPHECEYALGYYRPGSCAPWMIPPVPLSVRGAASAAGFYTAGTVLIP